MNKDNLTQEYNIIESFANKMLSNEYQTDHEIQHIIDEHFWDMIQDKIQQNYERSKD